MAIGALHSTFNNGHAVEQQGEMAIDKGTFIKIIVKRKNAPTLADTHQHVVSL